MFKVGDIYSEDQSDLIHIVDVTSDGWVVYDATSPKGITTEGCAMSLKKAEALRAIGRWAQLGGHRQVVDPPTYADSRPTGVTLALPENIKAAEWLKVTRYDQPKGESPESLTCKHEPKTYVGLWRETFNYCNQCGVKL